MSESTLLTEKFYREANAASAAEPARGLASKCERAMARASLLIGGVMLVCVGFVAVGMYSTAKARVGSGAKHSTSAVDWLLWFSGAKEGQTLEKFVADRAQQNQRDLEDKFRASPAYPLQGKMIDWKASQLQMQPAPFSQPAGRRSR